MKCKNCGADYKTRELKCPYCQTENIIGKMWMAERSDAELEYERKRREMGKKSSVYVFDRVLTRSIIILILAFVILFAGTFSCLFLSYKIEDALNYINRDKIEARLNEYYTKGEYEKMYAYMHDKDIDGRDYYGYMQAALLSYYYNEYLNYKYNFLSMTPEKQLKDDYCLEYAIKNSIIVYLLDCGNYENLVSMNAELYEEYQREITSFWVATLELTEEEVEYLSENGKHMSNSELDALVALVKERCINYD